LSFNSRLANAPLDKLNCKNTSPRTVSILTVAFLFYLAPQKHQRLNANQIQHRKLEKASCLNATTTSFSRDANSSNVNSNTPISIGLIIASLLVSMLGYCAFDLSWVNAFLNAAMLMGGLGAVDALHTDAGKIFAGIKALYCGMGRLIAVGIFAAPTVRRFLHHLHLESEKLRST